MGSLEEILAGYDGLQAGQEAFYAGAPAGATPTQRNDRRLPPHSQRRQKWPLTCAFEPEVGFEPTTFRLRVEEPSSSSVPPRPVLAAHVSGVVH